MDTLLVLPEEELHMDHSWGDLLHHISNEVEFVPRAVVVGQTYTSRKNCSC